ncbi:uncharacterized protein BO96DRAFT_184940 [Aspergillus niger CBS 101883]|uniref:uncharacterized protein n=1 Tax=Aspergillus lacticoffeatus (strain CBS 101883) TaxID=1450533 RepID=UPI000D7EBD98|nr:uncharacterized protein BO96DRAFT_184940 [Aspergillus niger CBS 101883]PYH60219.1 hypothetical protein BO96DRAFT_184940 [Aspergillus niger CBS 101883]
MNWGGGGACLDGPWFASRAGGWAAGELLCGVCFWIMHSSQSVYAHTHAAHKHTHTHTHTHPFTHLASPMSIPAMMEWFPPVCLLLGGKFHSTFNPPFLRGSLIDHAIRCTLCAGITLTVETVVYPSHHHPPPILP